MRRKFLVTIDGKKDAIEKVKGYLESVLSQCKDPLWGEIIDSYEIREVREHEQCKRAGATDN